MNGVELFELSLDLHHKASQLEQDRDDLQVITLGFQLRLLADEVSDYSKEKRQAGLGERVSWWIGSDYKNLPASTAPCK